MNIQRAAAFFVWAIVAVLLVLLYRMGGPSSYEEMKPRISFSQFLSEIDACKVRDIEITGNFNDGRGMVRVAAPSDTSEPQRLFGKNVMINSRY